MRATVRDAMSTDVVSVRSQTSIDDAERLVVQYCLSELFVTNEQGRLVGTLPDYVILKRRLAKAPRPRQTVEHFMSRRFLVIDADSPVCVAARYLREHVHNRLAVVEGMSLIGQITRGAVLQLLSQNTCDTQPCEAHLSPEIRQIHRPRLISSSMISQTNAVR